MVEKLFLTQYFVDRAREYAKTLGKSDEWFDNWVENYVEIIQPLSYEKIDAATYYDESVTYEYSDMHAFMQELLDAERKKILSEMFETSNADRMRGASPEHLILDEAIYNFDTREPESIPERVIVHVVDDNGEDHYIEMPNIQHRKGAW